MIPESITRVHHFDFTNFWCFKNLKKKDVALRAFLLLYENIIASTIAYKIQVWYGLRLVLKIILYIYYLWSIRHDARYIVNVTVTLNNV